MHEPRSEIDHEILEEIGEIEEVVEANTKSEEVAAESAEKTGAAKASVSVGSADNAATTLKKPRAVSTYKPLPKHVQTTNTIVRSLNRLEEADRVRVIAALNAYYAG